MPLARDREGLHGDLGHGGAVALMPVTPADRLRLVGLLTNVAMNVPASPAAC